MSTKMLECMEVHCPSCQKWRKVEIITLADNWEEAEEINEHPPKGHVCSCGETLVKKLEYQ